MKYFSLVGSYSGGVLIGRRWVRVKDLNRIDKAGWERHQGPLTPAMSRCLKGYVMSAEALFPDLAKKRLERNEKARERHWVKTGAAGAIPWMKRNGWL